MKTKKFRKESNVKVILISDEDEDERNSEDLKENEDDEDSALSEYSSSDFDDERDQDFSIFRPNIEVKKKPIVIVPTINPTMSKDFICDYCQHSFKAKQGLTRHVQSHLAVSVPWKCDVNNCKFAASSKKKLNLHKFHSHNIALPLNKNDYIVENNNQKKVKSTPIKASHFSCFCGASFGSMFSLRAHKNRLHRNKNKCTFGCKNVQYVKTGHFIRHVKAKHPAMLSQLIKKPQNIDTIPLLVNIDESLNLSFLNCDKCEFKTEKKALLKSHVISHVPYNNREKLECETCHKVFTRATSLRVHQQTIHEKIRPYKCPKCPNVAFKQQGHLNDHIAFKHAKDRKKDYKCNLCARRFLKQYMLNRHQRIAHKIDSIQTPYNAPFRSSKVEKKFKCKCGKEFSSKQNLTKHKKNHKDFNDEVSLKMFQCPQPGCLNAFTQQCNLIRHQKAKGHLQAEELQNLKFSCNCGDMFSSYRGYSNHCDKNGCKKKKVTSF